MASVRSALVLFGSETGNAEDLALEIGRVCERLRFVTTVRQLDSTRIIDLTLHSLVVVVVSTTGQGELPSNAQVFWKALKSARLRTGCLRAVKFASFGLGDSSYPKFNWAHRKVYNRLVQLGASAICERGESDEQHPEGIDGTFVPWLAGFREKALEEFPVSPGEDIIPDDIPLRPKWTLELQRTATEPDTQLSQSSPTSKTDDLISVPNSIIATVQENTRLTPASHFQDTRHLILTIPGHYDYLPGSTVTIYPKNFPSNVDAFIELMSWTDIADMPLKFVPSDPLALQNEQPPIPSLSSTNTFTLRTLLVNHLDIMSIPRRSFFKHLLYYAKEDTQIERLHEFVSPDLVDELFDYTTRPRRSILETLADFTSVKLPWQSICDIIPLIRGRKFSIASGGTLKSPSNSQMQSSYTRIELLIAIVKYQTIIRRIRHGLASRYISNLTPGQCLPITLQPASGLGVVPGDVSKPLVMVAPGTGVAPMRALCWDRKLWRGGEIPRQNERDYLFFGCRKKGVDDYFSSEWEGLGVNVMTAYSRDQKQKVYVQDVLKQNSRLVYAALAEKGGQILVCGSSGRMPQAVRNALAEIFMTEGGMSSTDAEEYLQKMEKGGRYKQETW